MYENSVAAAAANAAAAKTETATGATAAAGILARAGTTEATRPGVARTAAAEASTPAVTGPRAAAAEAETTETATVAEAETAETVTATEPRETETETETETSSSQYLEAEADPARKAQFLAKWTSASVSATTTRPDLSLAKSLPTTLFFSPVDVDGADDLDYVPDMDNINRMEDGRDQAEVAAEAARANSSKKAKQQRTVLREGAASHTATHGHPARRRSQMAPASARLALRKSDSTPIAIRRGLSYPDVGGENVDDDDDDEDMEGDDDEDHREEIEAGIYFPIPRLRRLSKTKKISVCSTTSMTSSMDNPFINLMSETRLRKMSSTSGENSIGGGAGDSLSSGPRFGLSSSVAEEEPHQLEMTRLDVPDSSPPPLLLLPPTGAGGSRARSPKSGSVLPRPPKKRLVKGGSRIFEEYQNNILERATENETVLQQSTIDSLNLLSSYSNKAPAMKTGLRDQRRRNSWAEEADPAARGDARAKAKVRTSSEKDDDGPESSPFQRQIPARATWSLGKRPEEFATGSLQPELEVPSSPPTGQISGRSSGLRRSFRRLGKLFGHKDKTSK